MKITLEIAVSTPEEAVAAVRAGADRLELCAALEVGGVTPSMGLFARVRSLVTVPVYVLLRPRPGGFAYTNDEMEVVLHDIDEFLAAGADGMVFGALDPSGSIAEEPCRRVVERSRSRVVFHRAFDFVSHPHAALEQLVGLGFERVLTSGGEPTAEAGTAAIAKLVTLSAGRITVMPGGGVRPENVARLVRATGCTEVHAAARSVIHDESAARNLKLACAMGADAAAGSAVLDPQLVAALRTELDQIASVW